jgi:hypothetical protein
MRLSANRPVAMFSLMATLLMASILGWGCEQGDAAIALNQDDIVSSPGACIFDDDCSDAQTCVEGLCGSDTTEPQTPVSTDTWQIDVEANGDSATEPDCVPGSGCAGEDCGSGEDCISGICTSHLGEKQCTKTCDESCPDGWSCVLVGDGQDAQYVCLSNAPKLCLPCTNSDSCQGEMPGTCIAYGAGGSFCGASCDLASPCPEGFDCQEATTTEGASTYQCVATSGECPCSSLAIDSALSTACEASNEHGTCQGVRTCAPEGLSPCSAATPAQETCNGVDDDCDGQVDEVGCDDENPCTTDSCEGAQGCAHVAQDGQECLDGDPCTVADHCEGDTCVGQALVCDDENSCTQDTCDGIGGCTYLPTEGPCDDGEACTLSDHCEASECVAEVTLSCDDENPCTQDSCGPSGCIHTPQEAPCDDQDACTVGDLCLEGQCVGASLLCEDENACTDDTCDGSSGCVFTDNAALCDDGDVCTGGDACAQGACQSGKTTLTCDDGNPCTTDLCAPDQGCQFEPTEGPCDDKNACTTNDICAEGTCLGEGLQCDDANPCTTDICEVESGCLGIPNVHSCDDSDVCTIGDVCVNGSCAAGPGVLACDDGNLCTDDSCDPELGCGFAPNTSLCNDGNECTTGDLCQGGACQGQGSLACDDQDPCTLDSCLPDGGCTHESTPGPCDDGDPCTVGDQCQNGACIQGTAAICDDQNPCTDDSCAGGSCQFTPNSAPCDDGNVCTTDDTCLDGICKVMGILTCGDENPCTDATCDAIAGCQVSNNQAPCDDEDACTQGDTCADGACSSGLIPLACDDGSFCNGQESCDSGVGCLGGSAPEINDGVACTVDSCSDDQSIVLHEPDPGVCPAPGLCESSVCDLADGCQIETVANCCGNGIQEGAETCDDGNIVGGDGCSAQCVSDLVEHFDGFTLFYNVHPVDTHSEQRAIEACEHYWDTQGVPTTCAKKSCGGATYVISNHDTNCNNGATQRIWYYGVEGSGYTGDNKDWAGITVKPPPESNSQTNWY